MIKKKEKKKDLILTRFYTKQLHTGKQMINPAYMIINPFIFLFFFLFIHLKFRDNNNDDIMVDISGSHNSSQTTNGLETPSGTPPPLVEVVSVRRKRFFIK